MPRYLMPMLGLLLGFCFCIPMASAEQPYEFKFSHGIPKRIVVNVPGKSNPQAYWYMTYTVTNNTGLERLFLPVFEMVSDNGKIARSDKNIPNAAYEAIRQNEDNKFLKSTLDVAGEFRLGVDESKFGAAVWPETLLQMGRFTILVGGLNSEISKTTGPDGKEITLHKTLSLNFLVRGDDVYPGEDEVNQKATEWIMR